MEEIEPELLIMKEFSENDDDIQTVQVYDGELNALNFNHVKNSKVFDASKIDISTVFTEDDSFSTWASSNRNNENSRLFDYHHNNSLRSEDGWNKRRNNNRQ